MTGPRYNINAHCFSTLYVTFGIVSEQSRRLKPEALSDECLSFVYARYIEAQHRPTSTDASSMTSAALDTPMVLDYADMVPSALSVLSRPGALEAAQKNFALCFIDEFQDTSSGQFQLLNLLWDGSRGRNGLTVVGDDDQMIYGFAALPVSCHRCFLYMFVH